jgi:TATA-box binding protein (TBP) (component of TFIID and TFIIIB)
MPKTKAIINIQNVVALAALNQKVYLNAVVKGYPSVEYSPEQFAGLVFRLKRPKDGYVNFQLGKDGVHKSKIGKGIPQSNHESC